MSSEQMDIYNANLEHLGTMDRLEAHLEGKWHRTFHCWVYAASTESQPKGRLLFQGRSASMKNYPGMLDVSAAGHLTAGESVEDGVREAREELGIQVSLTDMVFAGERVEVGDQKNGQKNREFQSVYFLPSPGELNQYSPIRDEVDSLYWLDIADGIEIFTSRGTQATMHGFRYQGSSWEPATRIVTADDFLPRIQRYYVAALISAERLLEGRSVVAIS